MSCWWANPLENHSATNDFSQLARVVNVSLGATLTHRLTTMMHTPRATPMAKISPSNITTLAVRSAARCGPFMSRKTERTTLPEKNSSREENHTQLLTALHWKKRNISTRASTIQTAGTSSLVQVVRYTQLPADVNLSIRWAEMTGFLLSLQNLYQMLPQKNKKENSLFSVHMHTLQYTLTSQSDKGCIPTTHLQTPPSSSSLGY